MFTVGSHVVGRWRRCGDSNGFRAALRQRPVVPPSITVTLALGMMAGASLD